MSGKIKHEKTHTPGPWNWDRPHTVNGGPGEALAVMARLLTVAMVGFDRGSPETEAASRADAALISAAPDLKAACEAISKADNYDEIEAAKELALAALSKASGR